MGRGNDKESEFKETNNLDRKNFEEKTPQKKEEKKGKIQQKTKHKNSQRSCIHQNSKHNNKQQTQQERKQHPVNEAFEVVRYA